jgi:acyl-CoA thioester hydrolase
VTRTATLSLRVRYHECDPQGIVFNAHYLAWFDMASVELWRELFGSLDGLLEHGVDVVVAESSLRYRASARFDEELVATCAVERLGTTSLVLGFRVLRGETLLCEGWNRYVFVDRDTWVKREPPPAVRTALEAFV